MNRPRSDRLGRRLADLHNAVSRFALTVFRSLVIGRGWRRHRRERTLRSIRATVTYPVYAATTLLYAIVGGVVAALVWGFVAPAVVRPMFGGGPAQWGVVIAGGFGALVLGSAGIYLTRWWYIAARASHREVLIDESLPRTIAFVYALSRSGMADPQIIRTVAENRHAFGESAEELATVIKDVDLFGTNVSDGLRRVGQDSPSESFADFAENFANVLRSGRNISQFLRTQYQQLQDRRRDQQRRLLELYAALGEAYVAVLVAGPLFLLTILLVFGLLTGGTLDALRLLVYGIIPLANLGFIVYLDSLSGPFVAERIGGEWSGSEGTGPEPRTAVPDGGRMDDAVRRNRMRLAVFERLRRIRRIASRPIDTLISRPQTVFYLTGPIALGSALLLAWGRLRTVGLRIGWLDDLVILTVVALLGSFAVLQELKSRRIRQVEGAIPDLLDRLASANEAGMTLTEALRRVDRGDLGRLNVEVGRLIGDLDWGGRTERALHRFARRVRSPSVVRVVALVTNAMQASGRVGPVVRIAADEARQDHRLLTKRREEMLVYTLIVYLAFAVFLGIVVVLRLVLVPAMPTDAELRGVAQGATTGIRPMIDLATGPAKQAHLLVLFHGAIVQAFWSGFVAGQMGEGRVRDGAKHATVLVQAAYGLFVAIS